MKEKFGELGNGVTEEFYIRLRKDFTGAVEVVSGKRKFLLRFQDGCDNYLTSLKLTNVKIGRRLGTKEAEVPIVLTKPKEAVDLDKGYYHGIYVFLEFNKDDEIYKKEEDKDMEDDPDKEDMEDVKLYN